MTSYVFDASAIIAVINQEPGHENALPFWDKAVVSTVNLAEVATRFACHGIP